MWQEKETSRIRAAHVNNLKGMLGLIKDDKVWNERIKDLCHVKKGVNEVIN